MAIRLPQLAKIDGLLPWAQNLIRSLETWIVLRPIISQGTVTLSVNPATTTTTITDRNALVTSYLDLMPTNANAAASSWWVSSRPGGSITVTHPGSSLTRTYAYIILG